jgi:hypothetical protein
MTVKAVTKGKVEVDKAVEYKANPEKGMDHLDEAINFYVRQDKVDEAVKIAKPILKPAMLVRIL